MLLSHSFDGHTDKQPAKELVVVIMSTNRTTSVDALRVALNRTKPMADAAIFCERISKISVRTDVSVGDAITHPENDLECK